MTSNRLPNGQQIGLLELQVLGVIGRHRAWSRACSSAAIRAVVWSAGIGSDVADCGACKRGWPGRKCGAGEKSNPSSRMSIERLAS